MKIILYLMSTSIAEVQTTTPAVPEPPRKRTNGVFFQNPVTSPPDSTPVVVRQVPIGHNFLKVS
jgi:hypothetical protein